MGAFAHYFLDDVVVYLKVKKFLCVRREAEAIGWRGKGDQNVLASLEKKIGVKVLRFHDQDGVNFIFNVCVLFLAPWCFVASD